LWGANVPGKSKLTADAAEQAALRALSKSEQHGEADRARAIRLTLEGRRTGEIAAVLGVHVSTVRNWRDYFAHGGAAVLPGAGTAGHDRAACRGDRGGDTERRHTPRRRLDVVRLCTEIARRGGPAISARWLAHQLRQRGVPSGGCTTLSKGARIQ
jgi:transposase-like protein